MLAVGGDPAEHRALNGERAEHREDPLQPRVRGKRPMGEQPVKADRHSRGGDQVHADEDREIGDVDRAVPQQNDRGEHADERYRHAEQICESFRSGHTTTVSYSDAHILWKMAPSRHAEIVCI